MPGLKHNSLSRCRSRSHSMARLRGVAMRHEYCLQQYRGIGDTAVVEQQHHLIIVEQSVHGSYVYLIHKRGPEA